MEKYKYNYSLSILENLLLEKIHVIKNNYTQLTLEEEKLIEEIAKRFL